MRGNIETNKEQRKEILAGIIERDKQERLASGKAEFFKF